MHIIWDARQINNVGWKTHCVKSVQIRSFFWSIFSRTRTVYGMILRISPYSVRMRENKDQKKLRIWILFTQWMAVRVTEKKTTQSWNSFAEQITVFRCSLRTLLCNASIQSHTLIMPAMRATQLKIKLEVTTKRPVLHWYYYYL